MDSECHDLQLHDILDQSIQQGAITADQVNCILEFFRQNASETEDDSGTLPGITYQIKYPEITDDIILSISNLITELYNKTEAYNEKMFSVILLTHLASHNLPFFVDNVFEPLINQSDDNSLFLAIGIARKICDPIQGFLYFASDQECEDKDFFTAGSPDLETPFGMALTKMRYLTFYKAFDLFKQIPSDELCNFSQALSFLTFIQYVIVPPCLRDFAITCGYPTTQEIAIAISNYQDYSSFAQKQKTFKKSESLQKWTSVFSFLIQEQKENPFNKTVEEPKINLLPIEFLKLVPFLNVQEFGESFGTMVLNAILSTNSQYSTFLIVWVQSLLIVFPQLSFNLFDEVFIKISQIHALPDTQKFVFVLAITRFVEILCCLPERYLMDDQLLVLDSLSLLMMCVPFSKIRHVGRKLAVALNHFEAESERTTVLNYLETTIDKIERSFVSFIDFFPAIALRDMKEHIAFLPFYEALESNEEQLWQLMLAAFFRHFNDSAEPAIIAALRETGLAFLQGMEEKVTLTYSERLFVLNVLTMLGAITEAPIKFAGVVSEDYEQQLEQAKAVAQLIMIEVERSVSDAYISSLIIFSAINGSILPVMIEKLYNDTSVPNAVLALSLRGISWCDNFTALCQDTSFLQMFEKLFVKLMGTIPTVFVTDADVPESSYHYVRDFVLIAYNLMKFLQTVYVKTTVAPFPCCDTVENIKVPELLQLHPLFDILWNIIIYVPENDDDNRSGKLHHYAVLTLSLWFKFCRLSDEEVLKYPNVVDVISDLEDDQIMKNFLMNHINRFLQIYLQRSVMPGGQKYFSAMCKFFRAPHPLAVGSGDALMAQWRAVTNTPYTKYIDSMQNLYEEGGNIIAACLVTLAGNNKETRDEGFILIGSIVPLLLAYHDRTSSEKLSEVLSVFQTFSSVAITIQVINTLSKFLAEHIPFLTESVIDRCIDAVTAGTFDNSTERFFNAIAPWIVSVSLDLENRVISGQTDFVFMRFSCTGFIEKLLSMMTPATCAAEDSIGLTMWQSLGESTNLDYIIITLISLCPSLTNLKPITSVIHALYESQPIAVLDLLARHLSFMYWMHHNRRTVVQSHFQQGMTILRIIIDITRQSAAGIIKHLPTIFAFALTHNSEQARTLLRELLRSLERQMGPSAPGVLHDLVLIRNTDAARLAASHAKFLNVFDPVLSSEFSLELLRWALCCGNLKKATRAFAAYSGVPLQDPTVVGLTARALWIVGTAIANTRCAEKNAFELEYQYFQEVLRALGAISASQLRSGTIIQNSSLFWIPAELLKCNTGDQTPIFNEALRSLAVILEHRELFTAVATDERGPDSFSPSVFWKFHQPWRDTLHGLGPTILEANVDDYDVPLVIRVLNLIVQSGFPQLFSDNPAWPYTAALALLPWMWRVVTTDLNRFIFTSEDVRQLEATSAYLKAYIPEEPIAEAFDAIVEGSADFYGAMRTITSACVEKIDDVDLGRVGNLYSNLFKFGTKQLRIPVYSLTAWVIEDAANPEIFLKSIHSFLTGALSDFSPKRQPFISNIRRSIAQRGCQIPVDDTIEPPALFPELPLLERIVVVDIPHLYDVTVLNETEATCEDLNSFIPICPMSERLGKVPPVAGIKQAFEKVDFPPFGEWTAMAERGSAYMLDEAALQDMRTQSNGAANDIAAAIRVSLENRKSEAGPIEEEEIDEEEEELPDPLAMIPVPPDAFIPSMEMVNETGQELFEHEDDMYY